MKQTYSSALLPLLIAGPVLLAAALFALPSKSDDPAPATPTTEVTPAPAPTGTPAPIVQADA